jgi:hypothetical protein
MATPGITTDGSAQPAGDKVRGFLALDVPVLWSSHTVAPGQPVGLGSIGVTDVALQCTPSISIGSAPN